MRRPYEVRFPTRSLQGKFHKALSKVHPPNRKAQIGKAVQALAQNPRPYPEKDVKDLVPGVHIADFIAQYRLRIGDFRVLYDVDDDRKIVWIFALRKRGERTYK